VAADLREPVDGRPGGAVAPPAIAVVPGDPELRWSSQTTTIAGIEHELATFWALPQVNAVVGAPSDRVIAARTSVLNLVVVARSPELGERAASTLSMLTGRHPSRTLILVPTDPALKGAPYLDSRQPLERRVEDLDVGADGGGDAGVCRAPAPAGKTMAQVRHRWPSPLWRHVLPACSGRT